MWLVITTVSVIRLFLMQFELEGGILLLMRQERIWILSVADRVASFDNAIRYIKALEPVVLPLMTVSALFTARWIGRLR